jgi:hypothetical protein
VLATLIQKIFPPGSQGDEAKEASQQRSNPKAPRSKDDHITVFSNEDPNEDLLNYLLDAPANPDAMDIVSDSPGEKTSTLGKHPRFGPAFDNDVRVDITLRTQIGQAPLIMLLFTVIDTESRSSEPSSRGLAIRKISINFEIGLNGRITVTQLTGLVDGEPASNEDNDQNNDVPRTEQEIQDKLGRVLETSEDLGMLVEWVLLRLEKKRQQHA